METQKESESGETLAGDFTGLNKTKTPASGLDDNRDLGCDRGVENGVDLVGEVNDGISVLVENNKETEKEQMDKGEMESAEVNKAKNGTIDVNEMAENKADNEYEDREGDLDEGVIEHAYSVGDFVWGKIKSHPWWPGRIYDPSDASEFAIKYKQADRLLVAYFGDGSFSWCLPSQLKPFGQNFEEMSKQSSLKSFTHALDKALNEIGTLSVLEIVCRCIPQEHMAGLCRPPAVNAGIKAGVLVPKGDISSLSLPSFEPGLAFSTLKDLARSLSPPSRLEFVVLTSWLSAFYRAKGGYQLAKYCEPDLIEGLEDKTKNHSPVYGNDFSVPIEVPIQGPLEEECVSSQNAGPENNPVLAEDKVYHRRKQKSVAELLGEDFKSFSGKKSNGVKEGRSKVDSYSSVKPLKKRNNLSVECGENGALSNLGEAKEESEKSPFSRERKKSKYLSPPYTLFTGRSKAKTEFELESETNELRPMSRCYSEAAKEKAPKQADDLDAETKVGKENLSMNKNTSVDQVLSVVQSVAIDPEYLGNDNTLDMTKDFVGAFRKSVTQNGSNYGDPAESNKRKLSALSEEGDSKSQPRRNKTKPEAETTKPKKPASAPSEKTEEKRRRGVPQFGLVKQNLDSLKSMLSKCSGKISQEEKFELEGEIKGLLEKVSTIDTTP